jgi:hypothetical protein
MERESPPHPVTIRPRSRMLVALAVERELVRRRPRGTWLRKPVRTEVEGALAGVFLVTKVYEQVSYAPTPPDPALMHRIWQEGQSLRWRLWRLWVFSTI